MSNKKDTDQIIADNDKKVEELEEKMSEVHAQQKESKRLLNHIKDKTSQLRKDPNKLLRLYAYQRRLKLKIKSSKEEELKLAAKKRRADLRTSNLRAREEIFTTLRINREKGLKKVMELRTIDIYSTENTSLATSEISSKSAYVLRNTKVKINYLKSQQKDVHDQILMAQAILDERLRRKGEAVRYRSGSATTRR